MLRTLEMSLSTHTRAIMRKLNPGKPRKVTPVLLVCAS